MFPLAIKVSGLEFTAVAVLVAVVVLIIVVVVLTVVILLCCCNCEHQTTQAGRNQDYPVT